MKELQIVSFAGTEVVDSRDVAVMVEREHNELLKSIRIYCEHLDAGEIAHVDFFIESTYAGGNGQERPCYLITKKGCDMIANKMTGQKGVLFTAAYVTAFEKMRAQTQKPMTAAQLLAQQAQLLVDMEQKMEVMQSQTLALEAKVDSAIKVFSRPAEDHWKSDMDKAIKDIFRDNKLSLVATRGRMYDELERVSGCSVNSRLTRLRKRKMKAGCRYRDAQALTKLDAIAADKQLRAIFEGVVRKWQANMIEKESAAV